MTSLSVAAHNALISTVTMYAQILDEQRKESETTVALLKLKIDELENEIKLLKAKKHPLD